MDHPHQMSVNVHWLNLVYGLGSIYYNGHSGQEMQHVVLSCWAPKPAELELRLHFPSFLQELSSVGLGGSRYSAFCNIQLKWWDTTVQAYIHHTGIDLASPLVI